jgi:2-C-methyl-D-erythritol 2,4-cyclodiphosphate synthase
MRTGFGFDAHRLEIGRTFVLGGVRVESDRGAIGHSDADVLAHAVSDAILGAAAIGDLGGRFPASDPRWKDANSLELLAQCAGDVQRAGYSIQNVDATIVLESPRLAPYIERMRENLARSLGISVGQVSVKAKSSEGLGYTGDGTGVAASAVALIETL